MTRSSAIAISCASILLVASTLWQQRDLARLRTEHESLLAQAHAHGTGLGTDPTTSRKVDRDRPDPLAEARALADDLIRRAVAGGMHQTDWAAQAALAERLQVLNPAQLRVMMDAVLDAESIPEAIRQDLAYHFLGRLAADFPEEVLSRLEKDLRDDIPDHRFGEAFSAATIRFAERDPDAAWEWFQGLQLAPENRWFQPMQHSLLAGISRNDPARALRRAAEAGVEGTYFLRGGVKTLDQQLAALAALRAWSHDDAGRQAELRKHIEAETLKPHFQDPNRFDSVTTWIEQAALPEDEIGFLADGAFDLCYHIDPRETGKWIEWLCRKFPEDRIEHRLQRFFEDHRTKAEAQAWRDALEPDEAKAFEERLGVK